jgi:hypothetical protein
MFERDESLECNEFEGPGFGCTSPATIIRKIVHADDTTYTNTRIKKPKKVLFSLDCRPGRNRLRGNLMFS